MNTVASQIRTVRISAGDAELEGELSIPHQAQGIVIFAHGSGSSRYSPRNIFVAERLQEGGLATLLFDLLTPEEEQEERYTGHLRFNIDLLAERLVLSTEWVRANADTAALPVGYFGASTGGAAALIAAALRPNLIRAVVSRGGRPDLANSALSKVQAPTLLIVGSKDDVVLALNVEAAARMQCVRKLVLVNGATHLFEEPGALEEVAAAAQQWFHQHLRLESAAGSK